MSLVVGFLVTVLTASVSARSLSPHHGFLGGPWEVVVKMGHEGQTLRLPVTVTDENKAQDLNATIPVMGTPIKVKLERYIPDLKQETVAVDDPNGRAVAKLSFRGEGLEQDLWLSAQDVTRQSISSHIGGVAMRELPAGASSAGVLEGLAELETVGALIVTLPGAEAPMACPVRSGAVITLPGSPWKISTLRYVPHYSIDRETKEVVSASDKPVNPAVEIRIENGNQEYHQWLWSKFPSSPHKRVSLPFPVRFLDFHVEPQAGQYLLAVAQGLSPRVLRWQDGEKTIRPVEMGQRLPFKDKRYSFAVEEVRFGAAIETRWTNGSDMLLHPAVVATIAHGEATEEIVLEQNKPYHHKTGSGTLVVLYRRVP
ncbi:MAG: hypothetical protein JSW27_07925 [Phycisphaerales bacterium]|nr:MAG: hypothetical protein JSW27_07925 [Phycisphaerales bacterium]